MEEHSGDYAPLRDRAAVGERLAESVDDFRETLIALDLPQEVIDAWHQAATAVWDAVAVVEEQCGVPAGLMDNPETNGQRADFERSVYERIDAEAAAHPGS